MKKCIYGVTSDSDQVFYTQHKFDLMMTIYLTLTYGCPSGDMENVGALMYESLMKEYHPVNIVTKCPLATYSFVVDY